MKTRLLFLALSLCILVSCGKKGFYIDGTFANAENINVYFDRVDANTGTNEVISRTEADGSGSFELLFEQPPLPGIYRVRLGIQQAMIVIEENQTPISLAGDLNTLKTFQYTVTGSPISAEFQETMGAFATKAMTADALIDKVKNSASPIVSYMLANLALKAPNFADTHRAVYNKLQGSNYDFVQQYGNVVAQLEATWNQQQAMNKIKIGEVAPDIVMEDPDGVKRKLSDLKGQVVLLDFWASWCGPCRKANPKVVETYKKYNKQGFTVFSVSLDGLDARTKSRYGEDQITAQLENSKKRWLDAIAKDQLMWDHHVSDLRKWDSAGAAMYGVRSIPKTFLIDREGKIAYIDPRYNLEEMVKKFI